MIIDTCKKYADKWGFKFSRSKSICMTFGSYGFLSAPTWHLGQHTLPNIDKLDILGTIFSNDFYIKFISSHVLVIVGVFSIALQNPT